MDGRKLAKWRIFLSSFISLPPRTKTGAVGLGVVLLPHGLEDRLHLLPLLLGQVVGTDPLLQELQATLLLPDSEQLLGPPLVGGEAHHLPHQVPHELVVLGLPTLPTGRLHLESVLGGLVTLVHAGAHLIAGSHFYTTLVEVNQAILAW